MMHFGNASYVFHFDVKNERFPAQYRSSSRSGRRFFGSIGRHKNSRARSQPQKVFPFGLHRATNPSQPYRPIIVKEKLFCIWPKITLVIITLYYFFLRAVFSINAGETNISLPRPQAPFFSFFSGWRGTKIAWASEKGEKIEWNWPRGQPHIAHNTEWFCPFWRFVSIVHLFSRDVLVRKTAVSHA